MLTEGLQVESSIRSLGGRVKNSKQWAQEIGSDNGACAAIMSIGKQPEPDDSPAPSTSLS